MGNKTLSRRKFLRAFSKTAVEAGNPNDPIFDKYVRKSGGRRLNGTGMHNFSTGPAPANEAELRVNPITSTLAPYNGNWTISEVLHLLRRTGYGYKKSDADNLLAMGMNSAVNAILNVNTAAAPPINWYQNIQPDENNIPYGADWTNNAFSNWDPGQQTNTYRNDALRYWLMGLSLNQDITIREKMTWFWYHLMPVDFEFIFQSNNDYVNTNSARILYQYMKMFRDNCLGNYKNLVKLMAMQPAMMFYLNNQANSAAAPDENFARELMELFTLGKDPLSQYTQADVVAAAKVLTGWRVRNLNTLNTVTEFDSTKHDTSTKQFSSFFNNTAIPNRGAAEFDALIDMIFAKQQVVSEYICRRLYRYFVYYDIDQYIETNIITPLAQTFVANNWNILPVLQQLFKSEHFYDMANRGVIIKSPFDVVVGTMRIFNIDSNVTDQTNYQAQYQLWGYLNNTRSKQMEQEMGSIPNVSGWSAYYQEPAFHEYWINSYTVQRRFAYMQALINGITLTENGLTSVLKINLITYVQQFGNSICQNPNLLTAEVIKWLLPIDLSQGQKDSIKGQTLLYQQTTDSYWTSAWNNYLADPLNATFTSIVTDRLRSLVYTVIQLAEFQLM
ncbi:MAG: DUF1800 family protein [Ferruginibacter sp.]